MIIPALVRLYDRLVEEGDDSVAPKGYSRQQVSFKIVLNRDGTLHAFESVSVTTLREIRKRVKGKEVVETKEDKRPAALLLPGQSKPSGSGLNPCFLWDNSSYLLGYKFEDDEPERTKAAFEAFRARHVELIKQIDDPGFLAVCTFLRKWNPSDARLHQVLEEVTTNFGVFQLRGVAGYVHEREKVRKWWSEHNSAMDEHDDTAGRAVSLSDGRRGPVARLHEPKIKGVAGAQSSGAAIVSFNQPAFTSYGKEQGANSPVSVDDAFKYCTALNRLTTDDKRRVRLAGDTVVFWAERPAEGAESILAQAMGEPAPDERARDLYRRVLDGKPVKELGDVSTPFYVLGLSPNTSRLSVRLWLRSTVGDVAVRLKQHHDRLAMEPAPPEARPHTLRAIVSETAMAKGGFPDSERVSPALGAGLARAVLSDTRYPEALLSGVLARVQVEGLAHKDTRSDWRFAQHRRCAIIRACLIRNHQLEVPVALDTQRTDPPYLLGRLFAVLERVQESAQGKDLNRTIKDAYFGAASRTPAAIFPRLLDLSRYHLRKIENPAWRVASDRDIGAIMDRVTQFPKLLTLDSQGLFTIGYYHQRQSFFASKDQNK